MKIEELEQLLNKHGDISLSALIIELKGKNTHKCPKCQGKGYNTERYNAYPPNLPDSMWVEDIKTRQKECDVCSGIGYTSKELKAITETKIIGYK